MRKDEQIKDLATFIICQRMDDVDYHKTEKSCRYDQWAYTHNKYYIEENKYRNKRYNPIAIELDKYVAILEKVADGQNKGYDTEGYINWIFGDNKIYHVPIEVINQHNSIKFIQFPTTNNEGYEKTRVLTPCICIDLDYIEEWMIYDRKTNDWNDIIKFIKDNPQMTDDEIISKYKECEHR